jgi:hypothetical protein
MNPLRKIISGRQIVIVIFLITQCLPSNDVGLTSAKLKINLDYNNIL